MSDIAFSIGNPTPPVVTVKVRYAILDQSGCPRKLYDLTPSGFVSSASYAATYNTIIVPIDPVTALRLKLATPQELGVSDAFASTLALLHP
jgi:hypothetical protein